MERKRHRIRPRVLRSLHNSTGRRGLWKAKPTIKVMTTLADLMNAIRKGCALEGRLGMDRAEGCLLRIHPPRELVRLKASFIPIKSLTEKATCLTEGLFFNIGR
jgi:hypothetical protein